MYHALAQLFRPEMPQMIAYDTEERDIMPVLGLMFSLPELDARGLRVMLYNKTSFRAFDAEDGSFGPNRNIHGVSVRPRYEGLGT
jgi:hypothetical protein